MKIIAVLASIVCTFTMMGSDSITMDFAKPEFAKSWVFDGRPEKVPALKFGYDAEKKVFVVNNGTKKNTYFKNSGRYLEVKKGDVIHVCIEACGQGQIFLTYECFNGRKWTGMGIRSKQIFRLKEEWTKFEADLEVKDCKLPTTKVMMDFCAMASTNLMIRSFSAAKAAK